MVSGFLSAGLDHYHPLNHGAPVAVDVAAGGIVYPGTGTAARTPFRNRQAVRFDGSSQNIRIGTFLVGPRLTWAFLINPATSTIGTGRVTAGTNRMYFTSSFGLGYGSAFGTPSVGMPPTNKWTHVVCTGDGANAFVYYNGVQVHTFAATWSGGAQSQDMSIGFANVGGADLWTNGAFAEHRMYSRALSANEVWALYLSLVDPVQRRPAGVASATVDPVARRLMLKQAVMQASNF